MQFGMDRWFHPTLFWMYDDTSMLEWKIIHVDEMSPGSVWPTILYLIYDQNTMEVAKWCCGYSGICGALINESLYCKPCQIQGLYSLSRKTSYRKISWSLEVARFGFRLFQLLWNLTGTSAATLPRCLLNFSAKRSLWHSISPLRDFTRFGGKTSYRLVNRGPGSLLWP